MKKFLSTLLVCLAVLSSPINAENYVIDTENAHAFIQFRIKHLGYSWLFGRFNKFDGHFTYDPADPSKSKVEINIDPSSVDSNHAERDKHLRGEDFLHVSKFPQARFVSTSFVEQDNGTAILTGDFFLHGVTKSIPIEVTPIGHGPDPWGGYRRGFSGTTTLTLKDFGIDYDLGPASKQVELFLSIEGVRK